MTGIVYWILVRLFAVIRTALKPGQFTYTRV